MIDIKRYVLIPFGEITPEMIDACIQDSIETLRHVRFQGDATDWCVLKWKGIKPIELWAKFPVYSDQEMIDILKDDLNSKIYG